MNRCLGALPELPVVEALSFLDLTERDRFLGKEEMGSVKGMRRYMRQGSLSLSDRY